MKIKIHEGFRSAQRALDAAPPVAATAPAKPAPKAKAKGPLFGGKQAPPFAKRKP